MKIILFKLFVLSFARFLQERVSTTGGGGGGGWRMYLLGDNDEPKFIHNY